MSDLNEKIAAMKREKAELDAAVLALVRERGVESVLISIEDALVEIAIEQTTPAKIRAYGAAKVAVHRARRSHAIRWVPRS